MIRIDVPGREIIEIEHVVLDYNGTIALDGQLIEGAAGSFVRVPMFTCLRLIPMALSGRNAMGWASR